MTLRKPLPQEQCAMRHRHSRSEARRRRMRALELKPYRCDPEQRIVDGATDEAFQVYLNECVRRQYADRD